MGKRFSHQRRGIAWVWRKILWILDFVYAFLEMHLVKIVSFSLMALCCATVNSLHLAIVLTILVCLTIGLSVLRFAFSLIGPFVGILLLSKMIYQTKIVPDLRPVINCSNFNASFENTLKFTILDPDWWGYKIISDDETLIHCYRNYILVLVIMTLASVIKTRQKIARVDAGRAPNIPPVMYIYTTRRDADKNLRECLKYLINYGFYKFGVEITLSFCVFTIAYRMDVFSFLYAVWVTILFLCKRPTLSLIWPVFFFTIVLSILWQYTMAVGLSKNTCYHYPWEKFPKLTVWMFLPSIRQPPHTSHTLVDFILVLLIQRQQSVFDIEKRYGARFVGGSNKEVYMDYYNEDFVNPTPDHTGNIRSWLDLCKFIFMSWLFRITLAFEFWNGASNANILSLGCLVGAFVFLWIDYDLCLWHIKKILLWWNILLGYTVFVILMKTILEFCGCVYWDYLNSTTGWLVQLLFLECSYTYDAEKPPQRKSSSIYWDFVCFTLIIFQRRYFQSYYFLHEVDDVLGVYRLQAKGAKLMDELQETKLKEFQLRERKTLMKIKKNMNRIKAWQKRMQGLNYNEPTDHATAIYMGDYLMFEELYESSDKSDESSSSSEEYEFDEEGRKRKVAKNVTMSEFIGTVFLKAGDDTTGKSPKKSPQSSVSESRAATSKERDEESEESDELPEQPKRKKTLEEDKTDELKARRISATEELSDKSILSEEKTLSQSTGSIYEREKMRKTIRLFRSFLDSVMVSMIRFFKKHSRDYRYIQAKMKAERKIQKLRKTETATDYSNRHSEDPNSSIAKKADGDNLSLHIGSPDIENDINNMESPHRKSSQALLVDLINSICMFVMSKTELLCYIIIFFHTAFSPTLISLPLPLLVFFWGSLTTVRPTTTFWTVLIAYTEITVVIKALFQNSIFPWNDPGKSLVRPEYPPLFLGIHRNNQFVLVDLFLLLLLFLHRYKLKTLGLWNRTHEEETSLPQNLKVYRELPSERDYKDVKGNRSLVYQRKRLVSELTDPNDSISHFLRMATWKCTSRATAKLIYLGNKIRTKIKVKEIEGHILVTHDGRRLEPTYAFITQLSEDSLEGNMVLRVYTNDIIPEARTLFYRLSWVQHFTSIRKFFIQILVRDWRLSADFYTMIFIFEFLDFLLVFFGYSSFTASREMNSEEYFNLAENQVPIVYLVTMIIHFLVIIIDRILYLRKSVVGKLVMQFTLIVLIHVWMFVVVPLKTECPFNRLIVPQIYYLISCFYFLMSAYQLRVGYPLRVQGHFLCKKYGYVNYYAYKGLQFIPFFNQLRILLDFICIQSSLTMMEWIKMESIFQLIYENKCSRRADIAYPVPRGQKYPRCSKHAPGVVVLLVIIVVIWLPFIVFALFNTVAQANLPQEAELNLEIGNFGSIFTSKAMFLDIISFKESDYRILQNLYKNNKKVWSFLSLFDHRDLAVLKFKFNAYAPWTITSDELSKLNKTIQNTDIPIPIYLVWEVKRIPRSQMMANGKGFNEVILKKGDKARTDLARAFMHENCSVAIENLLPKFIHVTNEGEAKPEGGFLSGDNRTSSFRNVKLELGGSPSELWWKFIELADDEEESKISKIPYQDPNEVTIYSFSDKNIPKLLLNVSKRGIIGLYLSIVLVSWTFVRRLMWKYPFIMYDDMPNPDLVLKLCNDIYLARESHEFELEEDLYAKLIFLFRSPETMIKVTRLNPSVQM